MTSMNVIETTTDLKMTPTNYLGTNEFDKWKVDGISTPSTFKISTTYKTYDFPETKDTKYQQQKDEELLKLRKSILKHKQTCLKNKLKRKKH